MDIDSDVLDVASHAAALAPLGDLPRRSVGDNEWVWKLEAEI